MRFRAETHGPASDAGSARTAGESGFSLVEFLISTLILLGISAAIFGILAETQRTASYQTEVEAVLENTRIAMDIVERTIRQAGNDPLDTGLDGFQITNESEVRVLSDLTGSDGADPNKGDPDGDTDDAGEDVTIRFNNSNHSIEIEPAGGSAQAIADHISAFSMQYFDAAGATTDVGADVRRVRVSITGRSTVADPQTHQFFSMALNNDVQLATRQ